MKKVPLQLKFQKASLDWGTEINCSSRRVNQKTKSVKNIENLGEILGLFPSMGVLDLKITQRWAAEMKWSSMAFSFSGQWLASTPYHHVMNPSFLKKKSQRGKTLKNLLMHDPPPGSPTKTHPLKICCGPAFGHLARSNWPWCIPGSSPDPATQLRKLPGIHKIASFLAKCITCRRSLVIAGTSHPAAVANVEAVAIVCTRLLFTAPGVNRRGSSKKKT